MSIIRANSKLADRLLLCLDVLELPLSFTRVSFSTKQSIRAVPKPENKLQYLVQEVEMVQVSNQKLRFDPDKEFSNSLYLPPSLSFVTGFCLFLHFHRLSFGSMSLACPPSLPPLRRDTPFGPRIPMDLAEVNSEQNHSDEEKRSTDPVAPDRELSEDRERDLVSCN